ncbi:MULTISPECIES: hypothetical protein [Chromohalobacter]|uniref:Uncharacterized protein n=1 Tax=Chromohalobacter canadensis TaxID=141389 RepID=A0ABZ0YA87_9GAMM|nr:hypothetical protein [Chromohalobacter canadensis]MCK0767940.1 hypothetical protein [Chromohalobacter canadensis]WQH08509.1 hypothetical protein SR908_13630 [Chromohalobacter canadensis]
MAKRVITLSILNERITFYASDWPAIQKAVNTAIKTEGYWQRTKGEHSTPAAKGFSVADKSRLAKGKEV